MEQEKTVFTGFFRDGVRRIDLVLVIDDDRYGKSEMILVEYLTNIIKAGLDIEIESGVMPKNAHLLFVKIHAPAKIIHEYGMYFNVRRHFKESHVEFINDDSKIIKGVRNERELIKAMRKHDPESLNYSTMERSVIVYRLLQMLPFGPFENYFGINRLLKNRIILDVYPLHDGPYFFVNNQDESIVNGRQILFHTWLVSPFKMIKGQPLSVINEYLGGKVAFYFAFMEYFIRALFVVAVLSVLMTFIAMLLPDYLNVIRHTCHPPDTLHSEICYSCLNKKWCPIRPTKDYCFKAHLAHISHSVPVTLLCFFMGLWSILFVVLWSRRKNYLRWLWEINEDQFANAIRPEYVIPSKHVKHVDLEYSSAIRNAVIVFYTAAIYIIYFVFFSMLTIMIMEFKHWFLYVIFGTQRYWCLYIVLAIISTHYVCFGKIVEKLTKNLCRFTTDCENIKTYALYEKSYCWKYFVLNMLVYSSLVLYYLFAACYNYAQDPRYNILPSFKKSFLDDIGYMNCGPYGCSDEMSVVLVVTILVKGVLLKLPRRVGQIQTDYNRGKEVNSNVPCWEKEYELQPLDEDFLNYIYMNTVLQFGLGAYFVQAFPLMPLLIFLISLWDLSFQSKYFLTGCRRPLVHNISGMGTWEQIISAVGYGVPFFNVLCVAWCSQIIERYLFLYMKQESKIGKTEKHYPKLYTTYLRYTTSSISDLTCNFPIMLESRVPLNRHWEPRRMKWLISFQYDVIDLLFFLLGEEGKTSSDSPDGKRLPPLILAPVTPKELQERYIQAFKHFCIITKFILRWFVPLNARDVKETIAIENEIKHKYYVSKGIAK